MRIKYALEKAQGQILDADKLRSIALKVRQDESPLVIKADMERLTLDGINKSEPVMKELVTALTQQYVRSITEVIGETVFEMVASEIERATKEQS